jgi:hypothetical protein
VPAMQVAPLVFPAFYVLGLGSAVGLMDLLARPQWMRRPYRHLFGIVPPTDRAVRPPTTPPRRAPAATGS